jgi:hypothetical protein
MTRDSIQTGNIQGVGIAVGTGASVTIYGDIHYYPIRLQAPLRKVFDPLIEDRVRLFGGRTVILNRIMQRVQEPGGGYTVVTAPAGFGKTALLAALVHSTPDAFAYHFFTPFYGSETLGETFFLRNVVQQIAAWHGRTDQVPDDLDDLRALYQQLIDTPLVQQRVLVLDGLDEIATWRLSPYLSRRLPAGMHLVATLRDIGQEWRTEYQFPPDQLQHMPLGGLGRDEVADVLRLAGSGGAALANDPSALDAVMSVAAYTADTALGTDPFYVRLLAEDAALDHLTGAELAAQPRGLRAYLDRWWQDIKQHAGDAPTRDLFGTLTAALGPIGRGDLEAINPSLVDDWAGDYFDDVLRQVRRFVVGDAQRGYALAHPRLRQYLRATIKIAAYDARLLDYCRGWEQHRSAYALRYLARHLVDHQRFDELFALVGHDNFRTAQTAVLSDSRATLDDLRMALDQALAGDHLLSILTCAGAYHTTLRQIGIAQACFAAVAAGERNRALQLADAYRDRPDWGSVLLAYLGWRCAQANDLDTAQRAFTVIGDHPPPATLPLLAGLLARTGRALVLAGYAPESVEAILAAWRAHTATVTPLIHRPLTPEQASAAWQTLQQRLGMLDWMAQSGWVSLTVPPLSSDTEHDLLGDLASRLAQLELMNKLRIGEQTIGLNPQPDWVDEERSGLFMIGLQGALLPFVNQERGRRACERALAAVLPNPYSQYRDVALVAIGSVLLTADDDDWVCSWLQQILQTVLDSPGITFTFDMPAIVLAAAGQRGLPAAGLLSYIQEARAANDRWGTRLRALNAEAAALSRAGDEAAALQALQWAAEASSAFAGFAALGLLAVQNRWWEFGMANQSPHLEMLAGNWAAQVRDQSFRAARIALVAAYQDWAATPLPDRATALRTVRAMAQRDQRLAYIDHLSARWAAPDTNDPEGVKALIPDALSDATTLDAVLGRFVGLRMSDLNDGELAETIALCQRFFMTARPWESGYAQWG